MEQSLHGTFLGSAFSVCSLVSFGALPVVAACGLLDT